MLRPPAYVLVTPARNEERFIESTIRAVVAQTVLPLRWVIVSDGSIDATDDIVKKYALTHPWIELVRMPERTERHFAGKVLAFNAGFAKVTHLPYEVIVSLDADISFDKDYLEFLLIKLAEDPTLGLVGTPYKDDQVDIDTSRFANIEDVSGACQVFRRECFEEIGGFIPLKCGTVDTIAALTARMKGWKTRSFTERTCLHHRSQGTAQCGPAKARFDEGMKDFVIGNHPVWELFRIAHQMTRKPVLLRGLAIASGFLWAFLRHTPVLISNELMIFRRTEQMHRLARVLTGSARTQ